MTVESTPGSGSVFRFTAAFRLQTGRAAAPAAPAYADPQGGRVLLVGENLIDRLLVREPLEGWGITVVEAADTQAALYQLFEAQRTSVPFQSLVVDHQPQGMDGWALAARVKSLRNFAGLPIVIITSGERAATAQRCRQARLANYVLKPIRRAQLFEAMAALPGSSAGPGPTRGRREREALSDSAL